MKRVNDGVSAVVDLAAAGVLAMERKACLDLEVRTEVLGHTPAGRGHLTTAWREKAPGRS